MSYRREIEPLFLKLVDLFKEIFDEIEDLKSRVEDLEDETFPAPENPS